MTLLWIIVILVSLELLLERGIEKIYGYESPVHKITPQKFEIPFEEIHIPAMDGGELYGWYIPAKRPTTATLILIHGWSRNVERMMPYIRKLHPLGYNLLVFDARNHGSSTPTVRPSVGTFTDDVLSTVDFLYEREDSPKIGLIGLSVGGGASIAASGRDARIKTAVTVGALANPIKVMREQFESKHIPQFVGTLLFGFMRLRYGLDFNKIAPIRFAKDVHAEIFLIHGENDETIPLEQAKNLLAENPEKIRLWIVPDKGHSNCHFDPDFWDKVAVFLQETIPSEA